MSEVIPAGKAKGTPLDQASTDDIRYWAKRKNEELKKEPNGQFAVKNRTWLAVAKAELERRAKGGERPAEEAPPANRSIERAQPASLAASAPVGTELVHDAAGVSARLAQLGRDYHLVTPATAVDALPLGCGVSVAFVSVNPETDTYSVGGGKVGISGDTLNRIAAAAGISWDAAQSGRLDDASDARYVHYKSVGHVRSFDGSVRTIVGEKEVDLRDGSPQIEEIISKAEAADPPRDPSIQIREARKFILALAESKARNRAIASMGIRRSYKPAELKRPFAIAKLSFSGQCDDPELRREFALNTQRAMQGAIGALYPASAAPRTVRPTHPEPLPKFEGHAPPPVGELEDNDDFEPGDDFLDADGAELAQPEPRGSATSASESEQPSAKGNAAKASRELGQEG